MNLLSEVTPGPYEAENFRVWGRDEQGEPIYLASLKFENDTRVEADAAIANHKLFAASFDHALLLAAVADGIIDIGVDDTGCLTWSMVVADQSGKLTLNIIDFEKLDPFGCPILTDELRAELKRLLGIA